MLNDKPLTKEENVDKTAICYLTCNKNTEKMEERFLKLPIKDYFCYIVSDEKDKLTYSGKINHYQYSFSKYVDELICNVYSTYVSIFDLYLKEHFDYIWLLEDDVVFNGNFDILFNFYKDKDYDLICPKLGKREDNGHWWHAYNNVIRGNYKTKIGSAGGLGQIFRFSKKILDIMIELTKDGIYSNHEIFPFTVCNDFNLSYRSLTDDNFLNLDYFHYNLRFTEQDLENIPKNLLIHSLKF